MSSDNPIADNPIANNLQINGKANFDAHLANNQIVTSNSLQESSNISPLPHTNTTSFDAKQPSAPADIPDVASDLFGSAESAIDSALEETAPASSVPPIVDAPESDLRDSSPHEAAKGDTGGPIEVNGISEAQADTSLQSNNLGESTIIDQPTADLSIAEDSALSLQPYPNDPAPEDTMDHESPIPTNSEFAQVAAATISGDASMDDIVPNVSSDPTSSKRVASEREDDDVDGPAAKRMKTNLSALSADRTLTAPDEKEILRIVRNAGRTNDGRNFAQPVVKKWPQLAGSYTNVISHPMDFETIEAKLKEHKYSTFDAVLADLDLIHDNSVTYNGENHEVTRSAVNVRESIHTKISSYLSGANIKTPQKARSATPKADMEKKSRRSRPSAPPAQSYAPKPETQPAPTRRESLAEERPKRDRHPPKNKDIFDQKPKTGKAAAELQFCHAVLGEMKKSKHYDISNAFLHPVDAVALNIPQYHQIVTRPMDMDTITTKLQSGKYNNAKEFESDVRIVFSNCYAFNPEHDLIHQQGKKYEGLFNTEWKKKKSFMDKLASRAASPAPAEEESDEEQSDEDEGETTPSAEIEKINQRVIAEQEKLIHLMSGKKSSEIEINLQRSVVDAVKKMQAQGAATTKPKSKKPKQAKVPRKSGGNRKSTGNTAAAAPPRRKSTGKKQSEQHLSQLDKEVVSNGLLALPEEHSEVVMQMIRVDNPELEVSQPPTNVLMIANNVYRRARMGQLK